MVSVDATACESATTTPPFCWFGGTSSDIQETAAERSRFFIGWRRGPGVTVVAGAASAQATTVGVTILGGASGSSRGLTLDGLSIMDM